MNSNHSNSSASPASPRSTAPPFFPIHHSAFAVDEDNVITIDDVRVGAFRDGGALDQIGELYYRDDFYNKVKEETHRQILRIMAENLNDWVHTSMIRARFKGSDEELKDAIQSLVDKKLTVVQETSSDHYRLQHAGFAYWISLRATPETELDELVERLTLRKVPVEATDESNIDFDYSEEALADLDRYDVLENDGDADQVEAFERMDVNAAGSESADSEPVKNPLSENSPTLPASDGE